MSNRSGRSWYRLSSIVRPTPYSSRDPSPPRHVINPPPPSPPPRALPSPSPRSLPKETNQSLVPLSLSTKHDHETTHPKNILTPPPHSLRDPSPSRHTISPPPSLPSQPPLAPPSLRSPPNKIKEANESSIALLPSTEIRHWLSSTKHDSPKPEHKHKTTHSKNVLTPPHSSHDPSLRRHVISPPPSPRPQPLPPPSLRSPLKEVKEANTSHVTLSPSIKHDPPKPEHKHETTHPTNIGGDPPLPTNILTPPHSSRNPSPPRDVISPPPSLPPPSPRAPPKEIKEANTSPVPFSLSTEHDPLNPEHKHETTHLLTLSEKPNLISSTECNDAIVNTGNVIIIISGENKGAIMEIIQSSSNTRGSEKVRRFKSSNDDEGNKSKKHSNNGDHDLTMDGFMNSNVQMINSSVVYSSTGTHYDPAVHLSLRRKPSSANGFFAKDHGNGYTSSIN